MNVCEGPEDVLHQGTKILHMHMSENGVFIAMVLQEKIPTIIERSHNPVEGRWVPWGGGRAITAKIYGSRSFQESWCALFHASLGYVQGMYATLCFAQLRMLTREKKNTGRLFAFAGA